LFAGHKQFEDRTYFPVQETYVPPRPSNEPWTDPDWLTKPYHDPSPVQRPSWGPDADVDPYSPNYRVQPPSVKDVFTMNYDDLNAEYTGYGDTYVVETQPESGDHGVNWHKAWQEVKDLFKPGKKHDEL